jgi:DNA-binding CsgD family transcriptional regulator
MDAMLAREGSEFVLLADHEPDHLAVLQEALRQAHQARNALDAFGFASIAVRPQDGRLIWETPLARELLQRYFGTRSPETPQPILHWLRRYLQQAQRHIEPPRLAAECGARRLSVRLHQQTGDGDWLIVMREVGNAAVLEAMAAAFGLTAREAEVLYWVAKGKINRDVADILGASTATVKKHVERIFAKLGVETRTAAAARAINRVPQLHPAFEG